MRDAVTAKEMWDTILDVFKLHTILNKLAARIDFYNVTMLDNKRVLTLNTLNTIEYICLLSKVCKSNVVVTVSTCLINKVSSSDRAVD